MAEITKVILKNSSLYKWQRLHICLRNIFWQQKQDNMYFCFNRCLFVVWGVWEQKQINNRFSLFVLIMFRIHIQTSHIRIPVRVCVCVCVCVNKLLPCAFFIYVVGALCVYSDLFMFICCLFVILGYINKNWPWHIGLCFLCWCK